MLGSLWPVLPTTIAFTITDKCAENKARSNFFKNSQNVYLWLVFHRLAASN